jgi:choline kinase
MRNQAKPTTLWAMIPTVVLLAAGMSTRYGRLKQLEPVGPGGEALLDYAVFDARRAGFSRVLLVIREELEEVFRAYMEGRWPGDLEVVFHHQRIDDLQGVDLSLGAPLFPADVLGKREKPWGTAHALLTARAQLPGPFIVLNADDFYGESAFLKAADFLRASESTQGAEVWSGGGPADEGEVPTFGLVTYSLKDTLSEHGGVSRGICLVDSKGWLEGIQEVLEIRRVDEGISGRTVAGQALALKGSEPISTNFWIFTPAVFPVLEAGFVDFFRAQIELSSTQPEFLIPTEVNRALGQGVARVRGIPTLDRFLGITHPEDRTWVGRGLEEVTDKGWYPSPLWA